MRWKTIGQSVIGTSHSAADRGCDDAAQYRVIVDDDDREILICCLSDGAGSAKYAAMAAEFATSKMVESLATYALAGAHIEEKEVYAMLEDIYDGLSVISKIEEIPIEEYSCTLLGAVVMPTRAVFFQIGDGAIVRSDDSGRFLPVWWPENGEYQNTTTFITDDANMGQLKVLCIEACIQEVALFSDGLQMLALQWESRTVHQPFFTDLFTVLRRADTPEKVALLNAKLAAFLDSPAVNARTDDDKTLILATRLDAPNAHE